MTLYQPDSMHHVKVFAANYTIIHPGIIRFRRQLRVACYNKNGFSPSASINNPEVTGERRYASVFRGTKA